MILKRKSAIYSVVALMLCVAVYLNWSYTKNDVDYTKASADWEDGKVLGEAKLVDGETDKENTAAEKTSTTDTPEAKLTMGDNPNVTAVKSDYFSEAKLARQKARDESVNILNSTTTNQNASQEAKDVAVTTMGTLAKNAEKEVRVESLVVAKGYSECVAFINTDSANVIVQKSTNGLKETDVAKIKEIVLSETGLSAEQIKIIETA